MAVGLGIGLSALPGTAAAGPSGHVDSEGVFHYTDPGLAGESTTTLSGHLSVSHADPKPGVEESQDHHEGSVATGVGPNDGGPLVAVTFDPSVAELLERFCGGQVTAEVAGSAESGYQVAEATVAPAGTVGPASSGRVSAQGTVGTAPAPPASAPMAHHAQVVLLDNSGDWSGIGTDDATRETFVRAEIQKALDWWRGESGGQISSFTIDGYQHYNSALPNAGPDPCGAIDESTFFDFYNEAAGKFTTDFTAAGNHLLMVVAPNCSTTGDEGIGRGVVAPLFSGFNASGSEHFEVSNFTESWRFETATHELGHNFGLQHAFWRNPDGTVDEYADEFSPMGFGHGFGPEWAPSRLSQGHRDMLAVHGTNEVLLMSNPESLPGVDVTVHARSGTDDPRAVEIPVQACPVNTFETSNGNSSPQCTVWLEFRNGTDFDGGSAYTTQAPFSPGVTATETYVDSGATFLAAKEAYADYITDSASYSTCSVIDLGSVKVTVTAVTASEATAHVGPLPSICPSPEPTISGTTPVGQTLTAGTAGWQTGTTFTYQWNRNGVAIPGATGPTYVLTPGDLGATITLTVVGSQAGHESVTRTSATVGPVTSEPPTKPKPPRKGHHGDGDDGDGHDGHGKSSHRKHQDSVPLLITSGR